MSDWLAFLLSCWICSFLSIQVSEKSAVLGYVRGKCSIIGLPPLDLELLKQTLHYKVTETPPPTNNLNCGKRSLDAGAIVGGEDVTEGAWPWQVAIMSRKGNQSLTCGGTLIDESWVLTAAHCVMTEDVLEVFVGFTNTAFLVAENTFYSTLLIPYENYAPNISGNAGDIALIKLDSPVTLSRTVAPACLPTSAEDPFGRTPSCYISGFGTRDSILDANVSLSDQLKQLYVDVLSPADCEQRMPLLIGPNYEKNSYICVQNFTQEAASCKGDSGGPLSCLVNGNYYVVGVYSFGDPLCFQLFPNVYMRVSMYREWIIEQMEKYA